MFSRRGFMGAVAAAPAAVVVKGLPEAPVVEVVMKEPSEWDFSPPSSDPGIAGKIWSNNGFLEVSKGRK